MTCERSTSVRSSTRSCRRLLVDRADLAVPGARELRPPPDGVRRGRTGVDADVRSGPLHGDRGQQRRQGRRPSRRARGWPTSSTTSARPMGFFVGGDLDMPKGRLEDFLDWSVVLRSVLDGRPVHTTGAVDFLDRDGSTLDLNRTFSLDDDRAEIGHFLAEAGYLHLAGVFTEHEMEAVSARDRCGDAATTSRTTAVRGGRRRTTARTGSCACSTSTRSHRRPRRSSPTTASGSSRLTDR